MKQPYGSWSNERGKGAAIALIRESVNYQGDDCLIWPFCRLRNGYGRFGFDGKMYYAHSFMCELVNGPRPTPKHEAAHSCGKGHEGCFHPRHLSWKTKSENGAEAWQHTPKARNHHGNKGRLTIEQVATIRELRGEKTQAEIAAMFNISEPTVRDIYLGRTHKSQC